MSAFRQSRLVTFDYDISETKLVTVCSRGQPMYRHLPDGYIFLPSESEKCCADDGANGIYIQFFTSNEVAYFEIIFPFN